MPPVVADVRDWAAVLTGLDTARGRAFAAADLAPLAEADAPGSPAWERDAAAVRDLVARGLRVAGLSVEIVQATLVRERGREAVVAVVDRRSGYDLVDADGSVVETRPPAEERRWRVRLRQTADGWRAAGVQPW